MFSEGAGVRQTQETHSRFQERIDQRLTSLELMRQQASPTGPVSLSDELYQQLSFKKCCARERRLQGLAACTCRLTTVNLEQRFISSCVVVNATPSEVGQAAWKPKRRVPSM